MKEINIGLFGFGTVGTGIYKVLGSARNAHAAIRHICVRSLQKKRDIELPEGMLTDKAQTVDNADIRAIGQTLGMNLRHIGNLDVDIFEKDGTYYVLELNPRFGGGFPFSYEAGVNFPGAIIEWLKGNEIDENMLQPRYGETYAKCDYLVKVN